MEDIEKKILKALEEIGPTFISKLSNRILENQIAVTGIIKKMVKEKLVERVEEVMVTYKTKEDNVVVKHRNHTYYRLTKKGEKIAAEISDVKLELREAFKTYNKALQNRLDNEQQEQGKILIYSVVDYPYSGEIAVQKILGSYLESCEITREATVTLRGELPGEIREKLKLLNNVVVI